MKRTTRLATVLPWMIAAVGIAGCTDAQPTAPPAHGTLGFNTAATADQEYLLGTDAEFARLAREAPGFGGMFYDATGRLNIYVTRPTHQSVHSRQNVFARVSERLRAGARPVPAVDDVIFLEGARDWSELTALHGRMFSVLGESGVVFTDIDETRNELRVGVLAGTSEGEILAALHDVGVPDDAVGLESTQPIVPLNGHSLRDFQRPIGGGLQIGFDWPDEGSFICTLGFSVLRGAPERDERYFFTNSHCTGSMGVVTGIEYWMPRSPGLGGPGQLVGIEVEDPPFHGPPRCAPGWLCRESDAALVRYVEEAPVTLGVLYRTEFANTQEPGSIDVEDEARPYFSIVAEQPHPLVGEVLDKMGRTSGWTRGPVTRSCVSFRISSTPPTALLCQDVVHAFATFGDSGSPVFQRLGSANNVKVYGLLWGASVSGPPYSFVFSAVDNIRLEFGGPECRLPGPGPIVSVRCPMNRSFRTH